MGNERTLADGGRERWFQFILWVLPTRSSLSNPVGRPTSRSPLPFSSSYACKRAAPSSTNAPLSRPFRFSTSILLADSIVPLVSSRATSLPSFFPLFKEKNFPFFLLLLLLFIFFFFVSRFSNTQSSLLRVDRNTSNYRIDDDTWMNRKDFHIDLRDNFFPNLFSFFRIDIYVSHPIGCASFYPQEKLKRSRRYTHSSCTHTYRDPTATFISPFPNVEIRDCGLG